MPSYLEKEQVERIQPHLDNIQAILNLYDTKLGLFGRGAGMVKSTQNRYASMELTRQDNQLAYKSLYDQANKDLASASRTDLSVLDNVANAGKVFDPINKNKDIMGDHAYTTHVEQQLSIADSQRIKDPKKFNQASYDRIKYQQELFKIVPDKQSWQQFYANKKSYDPYYDKTDEIKTLQDIFRTDVIDKEDSMSHPGYVIGTKDASWVKGKWQAFVEANASPQLKAQLQTEAEAGYMKMMLLGKDTLGAVYNLYNQEFNKLKSNRIAEYNQELNDATLMRNTLSKTASDYNERYNEFTKQIDYASSNIAKLKDDKNPANTLSTDIGNINMLPSGENIAASLYSHDYFDQIGSSFAHKDKKVAQKMDGAYFATKNLEARKAEMVEDQRQFGLTQNFKERQLQQSWDIAQLNNSTELLKAGMKLNKDGSLSHIGATGDLYSENAVASTGQVDPEKIGKELLDGIEDLQQNGYSAIYKTILGSHFGNQTYINDLSSAGDKRLDQVITEGGVEERDKIKQFIADGYWGSALYDNMGITDNDPKTAKEKLMNVLDSQPASKIMSLLYQSLGNSRITDTLVSNMADKPNGIKLKTDLEIANQNMTSTVDQFNSTYGPQVAEYLKSTGYPSSVDPNTDLGRMGVKGYMQDGKYRVPSKDEISNVASLSAIKKIDTKTYSTFSSFYDILKSDKIKNSRVPDADFASVSDMDEMAILRGYNTDIYNAFKDSKTRTEFIAKAAKVYAKMEMGDIVAEQIFGTNPTSSITSNMEKIIGARGATALNYKATTVTAEPKTRPEFNSFLMSTTAKLDDNNNDASKTLAALIRRAPDAVTTYTIHTGAVVGKPNISVSLDLSKLTEDERKEVPNNYQNIRLGTDSDLIPPAYKVNDPGYISLISQPKNFSLDYGINSIQPGKLKLYNNADKQSPHFVLSTDFYIPSIDNNTGDILFNTDGSLKLEHINDSNIAQMMNGWGVRDLEQSLQASPTSIFQFLTNKSSSYKELISYINNNRLTSLKQVPPNIMKQLIELSK